MCIDVILDTLLKSYFQRDGTVPAGPGTITSPVTGRVWMDRNLGASQVATSSTDVASYGDLYQWGRGTDGHQLRTSSTTNIQSAMDQPGHGDFILGTSVPYDWRTPQNSNLWQGIAGVNNPCPVGFRIPTNLEWIAENIINGSDAFNKFMARYSHV